MRTLPLLMPASLLYLAACDGGISGKDRPGDSGVVDTGDTSAGTDSGADTDDTSQGGDDSGETGGGGPDTADSGDTASDTGDSGDSGDAPPDFALTLTEDDLELYTYTTVNKRLRADGSGTLTGVAGAWTDLAGSTTIYSENLATAAVICDFDVSLTGVAAADPCPNCEFDFDVSATVTRDGSASDCDYEPDLSFLETADMTDRTMRYVRAYEVPEYTYTRYRYVPYGYGSTGGGSSGGSSGGGAYPYPYYGYGTWEPYSYTRPAYTVPETFQSGGLETYSYYGYYGYAYSWTTESLFTIAPLPSYGGYGSGSGGYGYGGGYGYYGYYTYSPATGTFDMDGSEITWSYEHETTETDTEIQHVNETCGYDTSSATSAYSADLVVREDVSTSAQAIDVWEVDVLAGETLRVSVDTVARRSAFAPALWINAPSTCTELLAYDNFACSFGSYTCAAGEWTATENGTAEIVVMAAEGSGRGAGEYTLGVAKR